MKILLTLLNLLLIFSLSYISLYFYWLKEYKLNTELPSFYKYLLLENKIIKLSTELEWQNLLTEKGWVKIIKKTTYLLNSNTIISWEVIIKKQLGKKVKEIKRTVTDKLLSDIYKQNTNLSSLVIQQIWRTKISKFLSLSKEDLLKILQEDASLWSFNTLY